VESASDAEAAELPATSPEKGTKDTWVSTLSPRCTHNSCYKLRMRRASGSFALRRRIRFLLSDPSPIGRPRKFAYAGIIFLISFAVKSLYAVDLAPVMNTSEQPAIAMTSEYDACAVSIENGEGILKARNDPSDTTLLEHPRGYALYLRTIYALAGRNYFRVQVIQNAINSVSPVVLFLIAGMLFSWRVGLGAGIFAALWHHLSYFSNLILPDSLCALPILAGVYFIVRADRSSRGSALKCYVLAGVMLGLSVWLRANSLGIGPFLAVALLLASFRFRWVAKSTAGLALASLLAIAPITISNYMVYGRFVPVQIGFGLNLWTGIGQAGGQRFGAETYDNAVAVQEAAWYNDRRYSATWYTPDGIDRDRARIKRSLAVIAGHPFWYLESDLKRIAQMFKYSADAPLVARSSDTRMIEAGETAGLPGAETAALNPGDGLDTSAGHSLLLGQRLFWARPIVRAAQRLIKETSLPFIILGLAISLALSRRRTFLVLIVPAYYFFVQSAVHTEFRYTLPMHYFLFIFAAMMWVVTITLTRDGLRNLIIKARKATDRRNKPAVSFGD
jgi:hypothetical protein